MKYLLLIPVLFPLAAQAVCGPAEKIEIDSEARCFETGVDISYMGEEGVKVACMQDKLVQKTCGSDGQITRLQAYRQWFAKLKQAENACFVRGGDFSYSDPNFVEPMDETFCMQAQPEIGSNMFEGALCNYRAVCPTITVICDMSCGGDTKHTKVSLYEQQASIYPPEDAGFLKRIALK